MNSTNKIQQNKSIIKVMGIGGGGGNTVEHMLRKKGIDNNSSEIEYIYLNTGAKSFKDDLPYRTLQIGLETTKGLGAGANPEKGKDAAIEEKDRIKEIIGGTDMLFLTAGMGGGTGTGAIPVIADLAKKQGILTIAVVTKPFRWEGKKRLMIAEKGIDELKNYVDSLIVIPNDKLASSVGKETSLLEAFSQVNDVLLNAVDGISELIVRPGFINIDFADLKSVMSDMGVAIMGIGSSSGENRAKDAFKSAVFSPLLENINITDAKGILVNVTCGSDLSIAEFEDIGERVKDLASKDATIIVGTSADDTMKGELCVTLVATGLENHPKKLQLVKNPV